MKGIENKPQRIRDPLHNLIEFSTTQFERTMWRVTQTRPFQRLRRIKQLGFSDLVYPGATHSRFAHSLGVFHTARQILNIINRQRDSRDRNETREFHALAAALLHDVGHGPFSHAFEKVGSSLGLRLANHEEMSDRLIRDSELTQVLNELGSGFANDVALIIKKDRMKSIEHAIVSSQFDADRLDYMRRDRLMCGTHHSAIDFEWLLANLKIATVPYGLEDKSLSIVQTLAIGPKAIHAAEAFVLGLFQLYPTVYFHKATRGAELLFKELLLNIVQLVKDGSISATGLPANHPLVAFAKQPEDLNLALALDDTVVWGALPLLIGSINEKIKNFSTRLRDRNLLKCIDIRQLVTHKIDPECTNSNNVIKAIDQICLAIKIRLEDTSNNGGRNSSILVDEAVRSPYKRSLNAEDYNLGSPLERINVLSEGNMLADLSQRSSFVAALRPFQVFRAYVARDAEKDYGLLLKIVDEEIPKK